MAYVKKRKDRYKKQGRPTLFSQKMVRQARNLVMMGYTHKKVAEFLEVDISSIYHWKTINKDFSDAMNTGRDEYDSKVVRSLYETAIGYNYVEKKKEVEKTEDGKTRTKITRTKKHVAPNVGAIKTWLYNRRPGEFKPEAALSSQGGGERPPAPPLNITYTVAAPVQACKVTIGTKRE